MKGQHYTPSPLSPCNIVEHLNDLSVTYVHTVKRSCGQARLFAPIVLIYPFEYPQFINAC